MDMHDANNDQMQTVALKCKASVSANHCKSSLWHHESRSEERGSSKLTMRMVQGGKQGPCIAHLDPHNNP